MIFKKNTTQKNLGFHNYALILYFLLINLLFIINNDNWKYSKYNEEFMKIYTSSLFFL